VTDALDRAQERWALALAAWEIPDAILRRAPESPWGFPARLFHPEPDHEQTPSDARALEALDPPGTVLDVGVGAGASSLPLTRTATGITGVDQSESMLRAFAAAADAAGVAHREIHGSWPDVAGEAGVADVVVCHHVLYNVAELVPFCGALTAAARRRVVVELTEVHPGTTMRDLWRHFHGLERPDGPRYTDAAALLEAMGLDLRIERWSRPGRRAEVERAELVAFVRRRLCLTADRDAEIDELIGDDPVFRPKEVVTMWCGGSA
jgi:hypothetical protein